ncbi:Selenoprotein o, partial [Globisporangium splendens]
MASEQHEEAKADATVTTTTTKGMTTMEKFFALRKLSMPKKQQTNAMPASKTSPVKPPGVGARAAAPQLMPPSQVWHRYSKRIHGERVAALRAALRIPNDYYSDSPDTYNPKKPPKRFIKLHAEETEINAEFHVHTRAMFFEREVVDRDVYDRIENPILMTSTRHNAKACRQASPTSVYVHKAMPLVIPGLNASAKHHLVDTDTCAIVGAKYLKSRVSFQNLEIKNPELVVVSKGALQLAGLRADEHKEDEDAQFEERKATLIDGLVPILASNTPIPESEPAAQFYCRHQCDAFADHVGDGIASYLNTPTDDEDGASVRWEVHFEGAGPALCPCNEERKASGLTLALREFLGSEHLNALGIPTTRAASVVAVPNEAPNANDATATKAEPSAIVMCVARSFLSFGSFEIFNVTKSAARLDSNSENHNAEMMRRLLDFTIKHYYPEVWTTENMSPEAMYRIFFKELVQRTAHLVAKWQSIGFCHGELDTNHMSILGDTLQDGAFEFMEHYDPAFLYNDAEAADKSCGRCRYENQPNVCKENLCVLADQLALVVPRQELEQELSAFDDVFSQEFYRLMREKLGLLHKFFPIEDKALVDDLTKVLTETGTDFTRAFRSLIGVTPFDARSHLMVVGELVGLSQSLDQAKRRAARMNLPPPAKTDAERHEAIRFAWTGWVRVYANRLKEESDSVPDAANAMHRLTQMHRTNPAVVLRDHVVQKAVECAREGEYQLVAHIVGLLAHPFDAVSPNDRVYAYPTVDF